MIGHCRGIPAYRFSRVSILNGRTLIGLCALSLFNGLALAPRTAAQAVTVTLVGPPGDRRFEEGIMGALEIVD